MRLPLFKLLLSSLGAVAALVVAQAPGDALGCLFGCCHGGCRPYAAARMWTPARVGYGPPAYWGEPAYASPACGSCGSCGSCGVASAPGCSTCGDIVYSSDSGNCQVSPAQSGASAVTPTPAEPKDKWKAKTYAPDEAPLSGSRTDSTDSSDDKIRSGTGGGAGDAGTGSTPADGTSGNRSGIPDDADETSRTTRRLESPAESSTAPDPGGLGEKVKIEPRNSRKKGPTPELDDANDAAPAPEASSEPKSGGISLPQASRLDHVVATRDTPARERVSLRKPTRSGQLVRVADYAKTPWNAPQQEATVARHK